jgi:hypothetical protein
MAPASAAASHTGARARHFHVRGIVVAHHGRMLRVLARTATVGSKTQHDRVLTLRLARSSKLRQSGHDVPAAAVSQGDAIDAFGVPAGTQLVIGSANVAPQPAEVLMGFVRAVNGPLAQISVTDVAGRSSDERSDDEMDSRLLTVDTSAATLHGGAVQNGQAVVVLGEDEENWVFAAADVFTFNVVPTVVAGTVTAVDDAAHTLTLSSSGDDASDTNDDDSSTTTNVDTSTASFFLDGNHGTTAPLGSHALVVGSTDSATGLLHAALVIAFDNSDDEPAGQQD